MAIVDRETVKSWFEKYSQPTEQQFSTTFDSIYFKDELIPSKKIEGLSSLLQAKADKIPFETHLKDNIKHVSVDEKNFWNSKLDRSAFNTHVTTKNLHVSIQDRNFWNSKLNHDDLSDYYLKTEINDKIITSQNEVISQILDNPDADINSIKELNNLIQKNLNVIASKLSFSELQSLTTEQKEIAQKNIGVTDKYLKLAGGSVEGQVLFKGETTFKDPVKFYHSTYFDVESEFGEDVVFEKGINVLNQVILGENEDVFINSDSHFIKSNLNKPSLFSGVIEMDVESISITNASEKALVTKEFLNDQITLLGKQIKTYETWRDVTSELLNQHQPTAKENEFIVSPIKPEMYRKLKDGRWVKHTGVII